MHPIHGRSTTFTGVALLALLGAACAPRPQTFIASGPGAGTAITDPMVADVLTTVNGTQIELAQLAIAEAETQGVREFAQRMLDDHRAVGDRFSTLLRRRGIGPTTWAFTRDLQENNRRTLEALRTYEGTAFDREFMEHEVATHEYLISTLENTLIPAAADGELESELRGLIPDLRAHLTEARRILATLE